MPKWLKILLLVGGLVFLSLFAMCGACAYVGYDVGKDVMKEAPQAMAEGERDALDNDQAGCLEATLERAAACEKLGPIETSKCQALTKIYGRSCIDEAKTTEGFCDGLPDGNQFMDMVKWPLQRCADMGREGSQSCAQTIQVVLEHCGVMIGGQGAARRAAERAEPVVLEPPAPPADDQPPASENEAAGK